MSDTATQRAAPRLQLTLVVASLAIVMAPPVAGTILIAPLVPASTASTVRWALADGALLVAPGPYPGSVVVTASRAALVPDALAHGAILVTARLANCGVVEKDIR